MSAEHMPSEDRLRELLVGRSVVQASIASEDPPAGDDRPGDVGTLTLSDGTVLKVWGNDGGCACSAGCYPLAHLAAVDNIITNVEVEKRPDHEFEPCVTCGEEWCYEHKGFYRIFVYADNERINLASFEGSDGNGHYGTGWWLDVRTPEDATGRGGLNGRRAGGRNRAARTQP